jgi:hypothetical protein
MYKTRRTIHFKEPWGKPAQATDFIGRWGVSLQIQRKFSHRFRKPLISLAVGILFSVKTAEEQGGLGLRTEG